jgi:cyclase
VVMPDNTFTDRMTLGSGDDRIELYYFGAGHTDGDTFIVFPARRAMAAGDMFAWKMAPLIDPRAGGSVLALPDTLEKTVNGIPNVDTVIEGHGDVNTWEGFRDYVQFNRALVDAAKAGMGQKTADEIAAGLRPKFPVFTKEELLTDMEYGGTPLSRAVINNVNVACQELARLRPPPLFELRRQRRSASREGGLKLRRAGKVASASSRGRSRSICRC